MAAGVKMVSIDPGNVESAYAVIDVDTYRPLEVGKVKNEELQMRLYDLCIGDPLMGEPPIKHFAIEMIQARGMPAGATTFETCVWIGRFQERVYLFSQPGAVFDMAFRTTIASHFCGTSRAGDPNVASALQSRFTPGAPNRGKGTKAEPGWFYGFSKDIWQAYAVGVHWIDTVGVQP